MCAVLWCIKLDLRALRVRLRQGCAGRSRADRRDERLANPQQPDGAQRRDAQALHSAVIYKKQVITLIESNFKPKAPNRKRNDLPLKAPAPSRSLCTLLLLHRLTIR